MEASVVKQNTNVISVQTHSAAYYHKLAEEILCWQSRREKTELNPKEMGTLIVLVTNQT